mgnify:CR=1 FL=1
MTSFKFRVEPLFSCLIGGVVVVNIRKGARAEEWKRMCKTIAPYVYCVFFTLAGGSVNFTGQAMLGGLVLVFVRFVGVPAWSKWPSVSDTSERPWPSSQRPPKLTISLRLTMQACSSARPSAVCSRASRPSSSDSRG